MKVIEIEWLDACGTSEDIDIGTARKFTPIKRINVGYLMEENEVGVIISWGFLDNKQSDATKLIVKGMITKVTTIKD